MSANVLLEEAFQAEYAAFRDALDLVADAQFGVDNPHGGHSAAWHALHICDWTRLMALGDRTSHSFGYLGWETAEWARPFHGPRRTPENAPKAEVLSQLDASCGAVLTRLEALSGEDLAAPYLTPFGETSRAAALSRHLRHIATHRGQVRLTLRQMEKNRP